MTWERFLQIMNSPPSPAAVILLILFVGVCYLLFQVCQRTIWKKPAAPAVKNPEVQFLEAALDDDVPRKPNAQYSYAEFRRDLLDGKVTFDEIYERSGGVFPTKPEDPLPGTIQGYYGPQGMQGFQAPVNDWPRQQYYGPPGLQGFQGAQGENGGGGLKGPDCRCPDRMKELQDWFKARTEDSSPMKVVPPPPAPHTVIHKIFTRGRR
jgi:hypothetical protein